MAKQFRVHKYADKIEISIVEEVTTTFELDLDDIYELHSDLGTFIKNLPNFTGISEDKIRTAIKRTGDAVEDYTKSKAYQEAKAQNDSKNKLAEDMRRCFVDLLNVEAIKKELEVYELDPKTKEVIVKTKKLSEKK